MMSQLVALGLSVLVLGGACVQRTFAPGHRQPLAGPWPTPALAASTRPLLAQRPPPVAGADSALGALTTVLNVLRVDSGLAPLAPAAVATALPSRARRLSAASEGAGGCDPDVLAYDAVQALQTFWRVGRTPVSVDGVHLPRGDASEEAWAQSDAQLDRALETLSQRPARAFVLACLPARLLKRSAEHRDEVALLAAYDRGARRVLVLTLTGDARGAGSLVSPGNPVPPFWLARPSLKRALATAAPLTGEPRGYVWLHLD